MGTERMPGIGPVARAGALLFAAALSACAPASRAAEGTALAGSGAAAGNPVLDTDFPDPTVIRAADGMYYAYATQTERDGRMLNIQMARSRDLATWEHIGDALPVKPRWASTTQDFWAPHVSHHDGTYYLYYSAKPDAAVSDTTRGLCLAVATSRRPEGPFADMGEPLQCGPAFLNIDPMSFDDPATGKRLLYWGSGFGPIRVQELAADRVSFAAGSRPVELLQAQPQADSTEYDRLIEGAWVTYHAPFYYLFYSGDNCCGPRAHYAVLVARSRGATGPFETMRGADGRAIPVVEASARWFAPGHNSVIADAGGTDWIFYHGVDVRRPRTKPSDDVNTRRVMLRDRLRYVDGWPRVEGN